ncbi:PadR family transcriptional regulator [Actinobaculum sp. 352]|uniref:PadR family transcriptional regulator n=1 Tax=Actinobaculum sp. 352 TaxID=2490946 RepID=UPI000F7DCCCC|nr:PadR family transcriptional regulator [Actinobaculum sp. 352]RTE50167.1 PadR family transcriptional regulator [Actinobaculum sp. 352]
MAGQTTQATQLRKGVLELAILALLDKEPTYGGQIVAALAAHPGLDSGAGTVYPILTRLAKAGLLATKWQESPVGPPRKYYQLTATGRDALAAQHTAWTAMSSALNALLGGIDA